MKFGASKLYDKLDRYQILSRYLQAYCKTHEKSVSLWPSRTGLTHSRAWTGQGPQGLEVNAKQGNPSSMSQEWLKIAVHQQEHPFYIVLPAIFNDVKKTRRPWSCPNLMTNSDRRSSFNVFVCVLPTKLDAFMGQMTSRLCLIGRPALPQPPCFVGNTESWFGRYIPIQITYRTYLYVIHVYACIS